ncbi:MAG TPA: hypothetical protein VM223_10855 [Planctomycetota bacterium]|nr:hypothetical protein [Planctomycetota bacterium]
MQLTIDRRALLTAAKRASRAVATRPMKPILENLLLTVEADHVLVTGTNLEVGIQTRIGISPDCIDATGPACRSCLLSRRLIGLLEADASDKVILTWSEQGVVVRTDDTSFTEGTVPPGEFPSVVSRPTEGVVWSTDTPELAAGVRRVLFAADAGTRWTTDAVCFSKGLNGGPALIATNGRTLACQEIEGEPPEAMALVPVAAASHVVQLFGGAVRIEATESTVFFSDDDTRIAARLCEGRFPKWQNYIPAKQREGTKVAAGTLLAHARRIAAAESDRGDGYTPSIKLTITKDAIKMALERSLTQAETEIPVTSEHTGEALFFPSTLLPALTALRPETVVAVSLEGNMLLLSTDDGWRAIIMKTVYKD